MRIIICDDDIIFADKLQKEIGSFFAQRSLALPEFVTYHTGEQLLEDTGSKDLIFLDMELPGIDGILVGRELKAQNPSSIIFVITSFSEYLDDAMRFHVFRYLTKPLEVRRLAPKSSGRTGCLQPHQPDGPGGNSGRWLFQGGCGGYYFSGSPRPYGNDLHHGPCLFLSPPDAVLARPAACKLLFPDSPELSGKYAVCHLF